MIDTIFTIGSILFILALIPVWASPVKPSRFSCFLTGTILLAYAGCYLTEHLHYSFWTTAVLGGLWVAIGFQQRAPQDLGNPVSDVPEGMEMFKDGFDNLVYVHARSACELEHCPIHNPSDHCMVDLPLLWRQDVGIFERVCQHGIGHPDPDTLEYIKRMRGELGFRAASVHGCDGCCHE